MFSFSGSRNNYNKLLKSQEVKEFLVKALNLNLLSIPDGDTLAYFWERVNSKDLEVLLYKMVNKLIRGRQLEQFRYDYHYLIAIDGTELYRFKEKHCEHCLFEERNGKKQYFHRVLEAKIVSSNGLAISIATEFIENPANKEFDKQDCELKAFYRLEKKIKKLFPRLPICLLLDGLYPNSSVFEICKSNNWKHIITFKDGSLKTVWEDFLGLFENNQSAIGGKLEMPESEINGSLYRWQNDLDYSGFKLSVLAKYHNDELVRAFISNIELKKEDIISFEEKAQLRWKIENEGFDIQKNHGYNLEHTYTKSTQGMKVVYLLIQIAHLINQFFLKADVLKVCYQGISQKYALGKVLDGIKLGWIKELQKAFEYLKHKRFQMRFNTS